MLAIAKIREDLVEVRYYYTRKKVFDEANESVGTNMILGKVKKYNEAMRTAPPLLYDLYVCLYARMQYGRNGRVIVGSTPYAIPPRRYKR